MADDLLELQKFCLDVIKYSFHHFDLIKNFNFSEKSKLFDVDIGRAVVALQVYLRDELRGAFLTSIGYITESLPGVFALKNIRLLLDYSYFRGDIFNFTLANLATLVEMVIYLHTIGLEFPFYWFPQLWSHIYWYRIRDDLSRAGGFPELIRKAKTRYELSGIYTEMGQVISSIHFNPYGTIGIHKFELFNIYDDFDPRQDLFRNLRRTKATELSISMMDVIYHQELLRDPDLPNTLYAEITQGESIFDLLSNRPLSFERLV